MSSPFFRAIIMRNESVLVLLFAYGYSLLVDYFITLLLLALLEYFIMFKRGALL